MLFDTEIEPASNAWRQPLQMRARNEMVNGLDWEVGHCGMDVDCVAFHQENSNIVVYGAKKEQCSVLEVTSTTSSPKISVVNTFVPPSHLYDMHWGRKNDILCASTEGRVFRYVYDPLSRNPPKDACGVYTLSKLKASGRPGYSTRVRRVAAHPGSDNMFAALENGNVHIWDTETGDLNISKKISENIVTALSWSSHFHRRVMVGGFSRGLRLFDVDAGEVVWKREEAHSVGLITDIAFHPFVPWWLVSAGEDGVAKIWDLRCGVRALATLDEHFGAVHRVAWCPTHTEMLATGSMDRQFKLWSLNLPPHYVIATKRASAPVAGAGFLKRLRFHSCGVTQDGAVIVAKMAESFVEPLVPLLEGGVTGSVAGAEPTPDKEVARLIYFRDFSVAFERALSLAEKLSFQHKPELALAVLDLAYQRSTPELDPNVHPDTPLAEALNTFQVELKNYSYYVPPGYHAMFGTQVRDELMEQIQTLRLRLELQRAAALNMCNDILDRTRDIVELLEKDSKIFPSSLLTSLIQIIMPYDFIKALEFATEIADVLAVSGDFNICLPIARLLLFPTIYEPDLIYERDSEDKLEEKIKQTQADDRPLIEKLLKKDDTLEQLTFMKKFYTKLWSEQLDAVTFAESNQPDIIISASVNRTYLNLLLAHHRYHTFYAYTISLLKEIDGTKFAAIIKDLVKNSYAHFGAHLKDHKEPAAVDNNDKRTVQNLYKGLEKLQETILVVLKVLYSTSIFPFPDELSDLLDQALKPLTQLLEKHLIQMLKIKDSDTTKPSAKSVVSTQAKAFAEQIKDITEGKRNNSDGIFSEKDLKRLTNSLAGFF